jgi:hypothetical protein
MGASERTVKNWILGRYAPCGRHLVVLAQQSRGRVPAAPEESDHTLGYAESRPEPLDYSELRGEGSTPVPLPPPP